MGNGRVMKRRFQKIEREPCAFCEWYEGCKLTGVTCPVFRSYVGQYRAVRGSRRIPDKTWAESWPDEEDKKSEDK